MWVAELKESVSDGLLSERRVCQTICWVKGVCVRWVAELKESVSDELQERWVSELKDGQCVGLVAELQESVLDELLS